MSNKAIGIITSNYRCDMLKSLTQYRPIAALPYGGRYRLVDFALSSMVNSGLKTVGIITPPRSRPILDHISSGKAWSLDRKSGGMFILPGSNFGLHSRNNKFAVKDLINSIEYLTRDYADFVILCTSSNIYNLDYNPILEQHEEMQSDVTLVYKEMILEKENDPGPVLITNEHDQILGLEDSKGKEGQKVKYFSNIMIFKRKLLVDIIRKYDYIEDLDLMDVLKDNIKYIRIDAFPISGYFGRIFSIRSYYQSSMDLLNPNIRNELFMGLNRIHTKIKDNPPTKYCCHGNVRNSLISSGCSIEGTVTGSIVSRCVQIEHGAEISNSIIMTKSIIRKGAVLENVILDKYVEVQSNTVIRSPGSEPLVLSKFQVV